MSLASQDELEEIKAILSQILQNQTAMMAQIVIFMNKIQQPNMSNVSINSTAMTQSFLEGLKLNFFNASMKFMPPSAKSVGPLKRKAELPLDNMVNTVSKHRRAHSQKPEDVVSDNDEENVVAVKKNNTEFAFVILGCALLTGLIEFAELPSKLASFMC